jgi:hypothetical protein
MAKIVSHLERAMAEQPQSERPHGARGPPLQSSSKPRSPSFSGAQSVPAPQLSGMLKATAKPNGAV